MKTNKKIFMISLGGAMISFLWVVNSYTQIFSKFCIYFFGFLTKESDLQKSLSISLFSAFVVSLLTAYITYKTEKKRCELEFVSEFAHAGMLYLETKNIFAKPSEWLFERSGLLVELLNAIGDCIGNIRRNYDTFWFPTKKKREERELVNSAITLLSNIREHTSQFQTVYYRVYKGEISSEDSLQQQFVYSNNLSSFEDEVRRCLASFQKLWLQTRDGKY